MLKNFVPSTENLRARRQYIFLSLPGSMPRVTSEFIPQAWHIQDVPAMAAMVTDALGTP